MIRHHAKAIFQTTKDKPPWARMAICGLATGVPLIIGLIRGELHFAVYASLIGYLIELNDHLGTLVHRLLVASISFMVLLISFIVGRALVENTAVFMTVVLGLTYWLGLMGGLGAEIERLLLFSIIQLLVAYFSSKIPMQHMDGVFNYALIAYGTIIIGMIASHYFAKRKTLPFSHMRESFGKSITIEPSRHIYALSYMLTTLLSILFVEYFHIDRGYWTIVTAMLIMKPDRKESIYRGLQRFIGTVLGVTLGEILILAVHQISVFILGVMFCAFLIPYAMKRNYWLVSFFVSIVVILLLNIPAEHTDPHLPFVRLEATLYGCLISFVGVLVVHKLIDRWD